MFKAVSYDRVFETVRRKGKYAPEIEKAHEFNSSEHRTLVFEYDNKREAENARAVLIRYFRQAKINLTARVANHMFVVIERLDSYADDAV